MAEKNKYAGNQAVTSTIKALRKILGDVSPAGIEECGNIIDGGGQTLTSALFALDNAITPFFEILVTCDTLDGLHFVKNNATQNVITKEDIAEVYRQRLAVKIIYRINDYDITIYSTGVSISVNGDYYVLCCDCLELSADDGYQNIHHLRIEVSDDEYYVYHTMQEHCYASDALMTGTSSIYIPGDATQYLNGKGEFTSIPVLAIKVVKDVCNTPYNTIKQAVANGYILTVNGRLVTSWYEDENSVELYCVSVEADGKRFSFDSYRISPSGQTAVAGGYLPVVNETDFKTINGEKIVGSGNITIEGGSGAYPQVDANPDGEVLVTQVIEPNKFYLFGDVVTLDIGFGEETEGVANEYLFQFSSGSSEATTLLLPNSVKWANDEVPTIETNMIYQVSILNGLATMLAFSNTPELDTFFISGYTSYEYQCVPGMTWEEWINSEYNVDGYFVNSGYVHQSSSYRIRNNGVDVLATDTIIANNTYSMYYYD